MQNRRLLITPYRGIGRSGELRVRGRVLVEKAVTRVQSAEPLWRNVLNTYRRFESDEVPGAVVRAQHRDAVVEGFTDGEGYFELTLRPPTIDDALWHDVSLVLPDRDVTATAHVLVPPHEAEFGIISDIDDTIVRTDATRLLGMVRSVIRNAASRTAFDGVAELYRALHRERNPIFYVSSSPWNLYELLHDFMDLNGIPPGPMFLQDWGISRSQLIVAPHEVHKLRQIQLLLDFYPHLRFILIGDSGQRDPEIYLDVIRTHHERIAAAFIRDVTPNIRDAAVTQIADEARAAGVEMRYVRDSSEAMSEAKKMGLI
ncbi:MAG TPA: phosphatase domain-containing protein [Thermoanaerobaculia bacterium]